MKFVNSNIKYPVEALSVGIQGKVIVRFVVTSSVKVTSPQIVKSDDPLLDAEALRVTGLLPDFIPGKLNGRPVDVYYTFPFFFHLSN